MEGRFRLGDLDFGGGKFFGASLFLEPAGEESLAASVFPTDGLECATAGPDPLQVFGDGRLKSM